jgi:hypothetical protein
MATTMITKVHLQKLLYALATHKVKSVSRPCTASDGRTAEATVKSTKYETPAAKASIEHKSRATWPGLLDGLGTIGFADFVYPQIV